MHGNHSKISYSPKTVLEHIVGGGGKFSDMSARFNCRVNRIACERGIQIGGHPKHQHDPEVRSRISCRVLLHHVLFAVYIQICYLQ